MIKSMTAYGVGTTGRGNNRAEITVRSVNSRYLEISFRGIYLDPKLESEIIKQGLDLKGGMYIALEADIPTLVKNIATNRNEKFEKVLNASIDQFKSNQNQNFFVIFRDQITNSDLKIARYFHEYGSNLDDIISSLEEETEDAINRVLEILQNRIDQFQLMFVRYNLFVIF